MQFARANVQFAKVNVQFARANVYFSRANVSSALANFFKSNFNCLLFLPPSIFVYFFFRCSTLLTYFANVEEKNYLELTSRLLEYIIGPYIPLSMVPKVDF